MDRKNLGIIASALVFLVVTLWLAQWGNAEIQPSAIAKETGLSANRASASTTTLPARNASIRSATSSPANKAMLAAHAGMSQTGANLPTRNSGGNNNIQDDDSLSDSSTPNSARVKPAPLQPRADPYALRANSGNATVRFSVRLTGDVGPNAKVELHQSGADSAIVLNDLGANGDIIAGDRIYGGNTVLDTSHLQPDTCLSYIATLKDGENEAASSPLNLCVSNLPVRAAASNIDNPVVFSDGSKAVADEIVVTAQPGTRIAAIQAIAASINATIVGTIPPLNLYQLKLPAPASEAQLTALVKELNARPGVKGASVNGVGETSGTPNDPEYVNQHGLQLVRAQDVWDTGATGSGVIVAVLDTGIDRTHADFGTSGDCQLAENDCGGTNNDAVGHGTQVAGIVAAKTNNNIGVAGIAYGSKIHSIQVSSTSTITFAQMIQSFTDAASYGLASIINASFSGGPWSGVGYTTAVTSLCSSINSAVSSGNGIIAAIAAGNNNASDWYYPARCNEHSSVTTGNRARIIVVGNSTSVSTPNCGSVPVDQRCAAAIPSNPNLPGSNYGAWVEITAPGSDIRTTSAGSAYTNATGSSFSTPMVAGSAAILKSCGVPLDQIESTLRNSANVTVSFPDGSSAPRLDIYRALQSRNVGPTAVNLSNNSLNEGTDTSAGIHVGSLTATDTDTCDKHTYSIVGGTDAASFSIGGAASDRLILTAGVLNFATKPSYAVIVRTTDYFGSTFDQALSVNVTPVNHPPSISTQTFLINEGSSNGTSVGTVVASDPDSGNVLSYSITAGNTGSAFSINPGTGLLSVNNSGALVYASNPSFALTVTVTDSGGLSASATVTVNVNKAPTISNQSFSINDGSSNGTAVGAVVASDAGDTLSYSITAGNTGSAFSINASTGVISVSNSAAVAYATNPSFALTVQVTDGGGLSATATITVNVNAPPAPVNNAPVIANQTFSVDDGSANGTVVGTVIASDPDAGDTLSYSITGGNTNNAFSIDTGTGVLSVNNSTAVSYTTSPAFSLTVQVVDSGSLSTSAAVTVNVNAPPENSGPSHEDTNSSPNTSDGSGHQGGGGGCSVMPANANPDSSLLLALLLVMAYGLRRRLGSLFD